MWYLAKLHSAKYLSEAEFQVKLGTLHQPQDWNHAYQHHARMYADYQLNTIAALIQALGRIERVWAATPDQHVVLCREAYHAFQRFLAPEFDGVREMRERMISSNLRSVLGGDCRPDSAAGTGNPAQPRHGTGRRRPSL